MNMSRGSMLVWLTVIVFIFTLVPPSMPGIPENDPPVNVDDANGIKADGKNFSSDGARVPLVASEPVEDHSIVVNFGPSFILSAIAVIVLSILIAVVLLFAIVLCATSRRNSSDKQHHKGGPPSSGHKADKKDEKKPIPKGTGGGNGGSAQSDTTRSGNSCTELSATANNYTSPADGTTNTNTSDRQKPKGKALVDQQNK